MAERVVIVTGAGSGIGRATARVFLDNGDRVALLGRRPEPLATTAAGAELALVCVCDVTDPVSVDIAFQKITESWGRIDVLFNNAGSFSRRGTLDEIPVEEWMDVVAVNLTGSFLCARAAFAQMRRQRPQGGRIINNGSVSAQAPRPGTAPYTATKHAITGLTKSLILDGRPFGIAAGQIDVGNALTDMTGTMASGIQQPDGSIRGESVIEVEKVADAIAHMASLPLSANIPFMTIMATTMPLFGRG